VKIDNLKAAILNANFYERVYQRLYESFAQHYGFKPHPCRVRKPNDKGKVEAGIKYVKNNFFLGRAFKDAKDVDRKLRNWLEDTCNQRVHGTTRKVSREVFELEERQKLKPLPPKEFSMLKVGTRKVYHNCHLYLDYNYYSVPFEYVGKEVEVETGKDVVRIYHQGRQIAVHALLEGKGQFSTNKAHYPIHKRYSTTEYQEHYQVKMARIGEYAQQMFFLVVKHQPRDWTRTIQGILSLQKHYPARVIDLACKRALAYEVYRHSIIKNICQNGSYNMPVEFNTPQEENIYEYIES